MRRFDRDEYPDVLTSPTLVCKRENVNKRIINDNDDIQKISMNRWENLQYQASNFVIDGQSWRDIHAESSQVLSHADHGRHGNGKGKKRRVHNYGIKMQPKNEGGWQATVGRVGNDHV